MLSGLLLVGLLAAYVAVCWRAPARANVESKQRPFRGQAASAAPRITDDEQRSGGSSGQGRLGLAAERTADAPAPSLYHGRTAHQWAMRYKRRTQQYQHARYALLARSSVAEAINLACAIYGNCSSLWRKARCESHLNPNAQNMSEASGLFQFLPSTWRTTPFGSFSIFSPYASALAAGWMHANGRGGEWSCR